MYIFLNLCVFLGTFTISNLGMFGVSQFDAILPPNTGSILAISASLPKVVPLSSGYLGVKKSMMVTITCDHRHIYGADAANFLKDLAGEQRFIFFILQ
jgi:pyruvate dehydrogenase E2 component (dihydrolipoamide acetyltransferase)